jgi:hypothetical protein
MKSGDFHVILLTTQLREANTEITKLSKEKGKLEGKVEGLEEKLKKARYKVFHDSVFWRPYVFIFIYFNYGID